MEGDFSNDECDISDEAVKAYPEWNLRTLQAKGCCHLKEKQLVSKWEKEIKETGGNDQEFAATGLSSSTTISGLGFQGYEKLDNKI
ncbi:hypothetical protein M0804_011915 [Polistes exclamans]|nr:hypothetical protein M0804_011915 [Polistes exclamans]